MEVKPEILKAIENIPLLSPSVSQLLEITAQPDFALADVIQTVKCDAMITARLLQVVNSAAFGLAVEVDTVDRAVSMLGARVVVGVALNLGADGLFDKALEGYDSNDAGIWGHDLYCAIAARNIGMKAKIEFKPDLAFTGGLLHDIGKTVVSQFLANTSTGVLTDIEQGKSEDYLEGEKLLLGMDHSQVGYEMARVWGLPEILQNAIRYHHTPSEAPDHCKTLCFAVHLGDILAMMAGYGTGSDSLQYHLDQAYQEYFELDEDCLSVILLESSEEFESLEAAMSAVT